MSSKAMPLTTHEQRDELAALLTSTGTKDLPTLQSTIGNQAMARVLKLLRGLGEVEPPTGGEEEEETESTERLQHKDEEEERATEDLMRVVLRDDGKLHTPPAGSTGTTTTGGGGGGSPATTPTFPNITTIKAAAPVTTAIEADWTASESDYNERAAWVMWNSTTNTFSVTGHATGTWESCTPTPKPADSGTTYHVGHYHIHPPLPPDQEARTRSFPVAPSGADRRFATSNNSPGFVKDFRNTMRKKGDTIYYDYGPTVRA